MPQNEIICIQIVKLLSADMHVYFAIFTVLSREFQKEGSQLLIAQSENISILLIMLAGYFIWIGK